MALSACLVPVSETILYSILYPPCRFVNERTPVYANGINNDFLMKKSNSRDKGNTDSIVVRFYS